MWKIENTPIFYNIEAFTYCQNSMEHIRYLKCFFHQQIKCYSSAGTIQYMAPERLKKGEGYGMVSIGTSTLKIMICFMWLNKRHPSVIIWGSGAVNRNSTELNATWQITQIDKINYTPKERRNQGRPLETSGCVRPERVNKWPISLIATRWWWWWWRWASVILPLMSVKHILFSRLKVDWNVFQPYCHAVSHILSHLIWMSHYVGTSPV
jgi:serine/threonine protein kinase